MDDLWKHLTWPQAAVICTAAAAWAVSAFAFWRKH